MSVCALGSRLAPRRLAGSPTLAFGFPFLNRRRDRPMRAHWPTLERGPSCALGYPASQLDSNPRPGPGSPPTLSPFKRKGGRKLSGACLSVRVIGFMG